MQNRRNYYRILHVQPDAPDAVIKSTHRTLMQRMKMHPDLGGDHAQAVLINEAFAVLSDPDKRAAYDRTLARETGSRGAASRPEPEDTPAPAQAAPTPSHAPTSHTTACGFCGTSLPVASSEWPESTCPTCGSALYPARKHQSGDLSRRTIERLPRNITMAFRTARARRKQWSGTTDDVSLNGMRFLTSADLAVGDCLSIECRFCSAIALVRSVRPVADRRHGALQVGVEFLTLRITHPRGGLVSTIA